jgi:crotonobetainyl-CoA:carnitine CoA-transferase CaiB-like acyl-CoA transferase
MVHEWAATMPDPEAIEAAMAANNLAVGRVRSVADVCDTDWARDRGAVVHVSDRGAGTIRVPNSPWRFGSSDVSLHGEPRFRGEDNRPVLHDLLGLDDAELDRLEAAGTITSRVPRR